LLADLQRPAEAAHRAISGARETLLVEYHPGAGTDFAALLAHSRSEDARLRQTSVGPHRDEVRFILNDQPSDFASEGQQRTLVLALKLGAAHLLSEHFATAPLLLLDDIFGELDPARRQALFTALPADSQKLITTTTLDWFPPAMPAHIIRLDSSAIPDAPRVPSPP
jgi:DNA replication and repair protein RecF